jgi:hypothetical protein
MVLQVETSPAGGTWREPFPLPQAARNAAAPTRSSGLHQKHVRLSMTARTSFVGRAQCAEIRRMPGRSDPQGTWLLTLAILSLASREARPALP